MSGSAAAFGSAKQLSGARTWTTRLVGIVAVAILLAACSHPTGGQPIGEAQARDAALRNANGRDVRIVSVELTTYGSRANGGAALDPNTAVWAVRLAGTFPPVSCGPATATPHPCPAPATSELILIDATTGAFIQGQVPAP